MTVNANDLVIFARIIEAGSFSGAAERTGLPKSTLSRRMTALESMLGERLITRSTRRLAITEFGQRVLEHAEQLVNETEAVTALALHRQIMPQGTLRVSLPPEFQPLSLVPFLARFATTYPAVKLHLDLSSRRVDLIAERFDIAVRIAGQLPDDNTLVARQVAVLHNGLYASPAYLSRKGIPEAPADLLTHTGLILITSNDEPQPWHLSQDAQRWEGLPNDALFANSVGLHQALAVEGVGIVGLSDRYAFPLLKQGKLTRVLPDWTLPPVTVWCVTPGRRLLPARTEAFIKLLKTVLSGG